MITTLRHVVSSEFTHAYVCHMLQGERLRLRSKKSAAQELRALLANVSRRQLANTLPRAVAMGDLSITVISNIEIKVTKTQIYSCYCLKVIIKNI